MDWTDQQKLAYLMKLPWTVNVTRDEDGLVAQVAEVPSAIATGDNDRSLAKDLWESLSASLSCLLEFGDAIPNPRNSPFPWEAGSAPPRQREFAHLGIGGAAWHRGISVSTA